MRCCRKSNGGGPSEAAASELQAARNSSTSGSRCTVVTWFMLRQSTRSSSVSPLQPLHPPSPHPPLDKAIFALHLRTLIIVVPLGLWLSMCLLVSSVCPKQRACVCFFASVLPLSIILGCRSDQTRRRVKHPRRQCHLINITEPSVWHRVVCFAGLIARAASVCVEQVFFFVFFSFYCSRRRHCQTYDIGFSYLFLVHFTVNRSKLYNIGLYIPLLHAL